MSRLFRDVSSFGLGMSISGLLSPPVFANVTDTERARLFLKVVWATLTAVAFAMTAISFAQPQIAREAIAILCIVAFASVTLLEASRRGYTKQASWAFVVFCILLVTQRSFQAGGIRAPGVTMYFLFTMTAGLLLGERAGISVAIGCSAIGLGLVGAEQAGLIQVQGFRYKAPVYWFLNCLYMGMAVALLKSSTQSLRRAAAGMEWELAERRRTEGRLQVALQAEERAAGERELLLMNLRKRIDELRVLHSAAQLLRDRPFDWGLVAEFAALVPQGWTYPECCEACICFGDNEVSTPGWRETPWRQTAVFTTKFGSGAIAIAYTESRPEADDGPFCKEEQSLLNSLAEMLSAYLDRVHSEMGRLFAEAQMRQSQKMEAMGSLAGGIAHDFNNLLAAIQGFSHVLEQDLAAHSRQQHYAERISAACERGKEIVEQILAFARDGAQQHQVFGLSAFVHENEDLLTKSVRDKTAVVFSYAPVELFVSANRGQAAQLLINLCKNASEAIGENPGVIRVETRRPSRGELLELSELLPKPGVHFSGKVDISGSYACLRVTDTGPGIAPDVLKRIFDPFFTTKKRRSGTGLGLSVVHSVVESHGGFVLVQSEPHGGAIFSAFLPLAGWDSSAAKQPQNYQNVAGHERIVIVDDEFDVADSLALNLDRLGYYALAVANPTDALEAVREDPNGWDVLIADQIMPEMTGADLMRLVKAQAPAILGVICTASMGHEFNEDPKIDLLLHKPFPPLEMARQLRAMLDSRRRLTPR